MRLYSTRREDRGSKAEMQEGDERWVKGRQQDKYPTTSGDWRLVGTRLVVTIYFSCFCYHEYSSADDRGSHYHSHIRKIGRCHKPNTALRTQSCCPYSHLIPQSEDSWSFRLQFQYRGDCWSSRKFSLTLADFGGEKSLGPLVSTNHNISFIHFGMRNSGSGSNCVSQAAREA